ncbi:hypothetical protein [Hyphobacterium sp.]|uniref:hypothetical protein n=1 Tax=Hyphobacterium sp. TaxID=2004662 RepID=UPI003748F64D
MSEDDKKTEGVEIRISPSKKSELARAATREGKSTSAVVRELIDGYLSPSINARQRSRAPFYGLGMIVGIALLFMAFGSNSTQQASATQLETDISVMVAAVSDTQNRAMMDARIRHDFGEQNGIRFTRFRPALEAVFGTGLVDASYTEDAALWVTVSAIEAPEGEHLVYTVQFILVDEESSERRVIFDQVMRARIGSLSRLDTGSEDAGLISISLRPALVAAEE